MASDDYPKLTKKKKKKHLDELEFLVSGGFLRSVSQGSPDPSMPRDPNSCPHPNGPWPLGDSSTPEKTQP